MRDGRTTGFILMGLAVAAFLGSTSEALPPATFFPALALFAIGALKFFKSSREALAEAERRTQSKLHPVIRENASALALAQAERRAQRRGAALSALNSETGSNAASARPRSARSAPGSARTTGNAPAAGLAGEEIELVDVEEESLEVTQDVSFPIELQRGDALADQLRKLNLLLTQGILTEEEYAIAKAKLLG